jgi:CheY-like chemotaxis protein
MEEGGRSWPAGSILVVEDEFLVNEMIADMVAGLGYTVAGRPTSIAGLRQALAAGGFEGVLLDLRLGDTLTLEAADVLAERGVPFAFVTGYSESSEPRHAGIPLLNKPFTLDQLRAMLERLIGPAPQQSAEAMHQKAG